MNEPSSRLWASFQKLASEHPECNGVKLTLEMQRWFIFVQQQYFLQRVAAIAQPANQLIPI
jgi:hypothetical protein